MSVETRTVFVRADRDGVGGGPVAHAGPGQHPHAVLGPAAELIEHERRRVQFHHVGLGVSAPRLHAKQLVIRDAAVRPLRRRRLPRHPDRSRGYRSRSHIHRRRSRNYTSFNMSICPRNTRGQTLQLKWAEPVRTPT